MLLHMLLNGLLRDNSQAQNDASLTNKLTFFSTPIEVTLNLNQNEVLFIYPPTLFVLEHSCTRAVTCFPQPSVCRARIVAGSKQETRSAAETVLFAGAGPPHGDPLLRRHRQVATTAAVGRQHCSSGYRVSLQATHSFCY